MNKIITVTAVSKKGRNRIYEHGNLWTVIREEKDKLLLQSIRDDYLRWMQKNNDPDFAET